MSRCASSQTKPCNMSWADHDSRFKYSNAHGWTVSCIAGKAYTLICAQDVLVCTFKCLRICVYARVIHACMHVWVYAYTRVWVYECMGARVHAYTRVWYACMHACLYACIHVRMYAYVCICTHMSMFVLLFVMHSCRHTCIHTCWAASTVFVLHVSYQNFTLFSSLGSKKWHVHALVPSIRVTLFTHKKHVNDVIILVLMYAPMMRIHHIHT
jgi:hypothetical protein